MIPAGAGRMLALPRADRKLISLLAIQLLFILGSAWSTTIGTLTPSRPASCPAGGQRQNPEIQGICAVLGVTNDARFSLTTPFRIRATLG